MLFIHITFLLKIVIFSLNIFWFTRSNYFNIINLIAFDSMLTNNNFFRLVKTILNKIVQRIRML